MPIFCERSHFRSRFKTILPGDTIFGLKYTYEEDVNEYDLIAHIVQRSWVDRRKKDFKKAARKDVEYIHKPIMSIYEKLFYRKQKKFHRPTKLEIMAKYGKPTVVKWDQTKILKLKIWVINLNNEMNMSLNFQFCL